MIELDDIVRRLVDTLKETGQAEDTLIFISSDNGPHMETWPDAAFTPFRCSKGSTWEGGVRVCTLAWWPGKIPAGTATAAMTAMMDVLPTFAALAGAKLPADRKLDGVDVWPVLAGDPAPPPRDTFHFYRGLQLEAVRSGPWKLHLASGELFNLNDDLGEKTDLAAQRPEEVKRLRALAETMRGDLGLEGVGPGCRPLGRVANPQPLLANDGTVRADAVGQAAKLP